MAKRITLRQKTLSITEVAEYHRDVESSLQLYFTRNNPRFVARFAGYMLSEVANELAERLIETDLRSALAIMVRIEATFRIDYLQRCNSKGADDLSIAFRKLRRKYGAKHARVPLEQGILEAWRAVYPGTSTLIGELSRAFRFRHWLAHGRYFTPKLARKYDYQSVYILATSVLENLPLISAGIV